MFMFKTYDFTSEKFNTASPSKNHKKLYAFSGFMIVIVVASAFFVPQTFGSTIELGLNYKAGEKMMYQTTSTVTNQMTNTSINVQTNPQTQTYNSTVTHEILGFDGETYTIKLTLNSELNGKSVSIPMTANTTTKAHYYTNLLPAGAPAFFQNVSSNPALQAYLSKTQVKVGEVWQFPVSTGNASLGLTGELSLSFIDVQQITVPGGTYKVFVVEFTSNDLIMHISSDNGVISSSALDNSMLELNGKTYLEVETCRLIKSELTQKTTTQQAGISHTSTIYSEKTLIEHITP